MPTPITHVRLGADEGHVDGDEGDEDVVDVVESIFQDREELGCHGQNRRVVELLLQRTTRKLRERRFIVAHL